MTARGRPIPPSLAGALIGLAAPGSALAQQLGGAQSPAELPWLRVIGALALCLGLAVAAAFALRSRLKGQAPAATGAGRRLRLVETTRLSHQIDVCVLESDDLELVVAASPQGPVLLSRRDRARSDEAR